MTILSVLAVILSSAAAVLAWLARIRWSQEFRAAKEQEIRAKDATIESLKEQIANLREMNPLAIREYFLAVRTQLEEYIDQLKGQLDRLKADLAAKEEQLASLRATDTQSAQRIAALLHDRDTLSDLVDSLTAELGEVELTKASAAPLLESSAAATDALQDAVHRLETGERVRIKEGPFSGLEGVIVERRGRQRLLVGLKTFGSGLEIDIDSKLLEPL